MASSSSNETRANRMKVWGGVRRVKLPSGVGRFCIGDHEVYVP
jgi:hypothetical protein